MGMGEREEGTVGGDIRPTPPPPPKLTAFSRAVTIVTARRLWAHLLTPPAHFRREEGRVWVGRELVAVAGADQPGAAS